MTENIRLTQPLLLCWNLTGHSQHTHTHTAWKQTVACAAKHKIFFTHKLADATGCAAKPFPARETEKERHGASEGDNEWKRWRCNMYENDTNRKETQKKCWMSRITDREGSEGSGWYTGSSLKTWWTLVVTTSADAENKQGFVSSPGKINIGELLIHLPLLPGAREAGDRGNEKLAKSSNLTLEDVGNWYWEQGLLKNDLRPVGTCASSQEKVCFLILYSHTFLIYLLPLLESNACYPFNLNHVDSIPSFYRLSSRSVRTPFKKKKQERTPQNGMKGGKKKKRCDWWGDLINMLIHSSVRAGKLLLWERGVKRISSLHWASAVL